MKKLKFLCAALTAILTLGNYTGGYVCAASDDTQTKEAPTKETQAKEARAEDSQSPAALTDEELASYYGDSVFVGDSIMVGFRNYSAKQQSFVHDIQFLAVGSYSAFNAMKPVAGDNVHPMYKGKKCQVWDAIPLTDSKRAFILLGMNDISILGLEGARDQYKELIGRIQESSPDIEIHIISVTYTLKGEGKGKLNNENLAQYNVLLQEMAEENGWGYLDLCTPISDGEGNLAKEYCSDGFVHLSTPAYALWETKLIDYANEQAGQNGSETDADSAVKPMTEAENDTIESPEAQTEKPETEPKKASKSRIETSSEATVPQENKGR